jgi:hypothetical protein
MKEIQCFTSHYSEDVSLKTKRKIDLGNVNYITGIISLFRDKIIPEAENTYVEMENNAYSQDWEKQARTLVFLLKYSKLNGITSYNTNNTFTFAHCNHSSALIKIIK